MVPSVKDALQRQVAGLSALLDIEQEVRAASTDKELAFVIVNRPKAVLPFDVAAFFRPHGRGLDLVSVSGVSSIDHSAPFVAWLKTLADRITPSEAPQPLVLAEVCRDDAWKEWGVTHALACFLTRQGQPLGCWLLLRRGGWQPHEAALASRLCGAFAHALQQFGPRRNVGLTSSRRLWVAAGLAMVGIMALPLRESVVAPAAVVPREPIVVAAPMDGVIAKIAVEPNQPVAEGQLLFQLDQTVSRNKFEAAGNALKVAEANLLKLQQRAFGDVDSKAGIAIAEGEIEQRRMDLAFAEEMLARTEARAKQAGIAVFADANDWTGKPVTTGERVMTLADPDQVMLDVFLPADDATFLKEGMEVDFHLNIAPLDSLSAVVRHIAYEPQIVPEGYLAYRLKADFSGANTLPRVGLRGTAKIYGDRRPLAYQLFRRPLASLRRMIRL